MEAEITTKRPFRVSTTFFDVTPFRAFRVSTINGELLTKAL